MAENPPPGGSQPPGSSGEPPSSSPPPPPEQPGSSSPPPQPPPSYSPPPPPQPPPPGGGMTPPPPPMGGTPPPSSGPGPMAPPPPPPGGFAPPPGGYAMAGGGMAVAGNLASPGIRFVQGLIDVVILLVINGIIAGIFGAARNSGLSGIASGINLVIDLAYWGYFLSSRGQSIGMMPFNIKVQDANTGGPISFWRGVLRGFVFHLELGFCVCIVGLIGLLWPFWDARKQAWHDKAANTIVVQT